MHIINIEQAGALYSDKEAIDLNQPAGDIIILSAADTDIQLYAGSASIIQDDYSVRIASLLRLNHPYSVDLYLDKTCAKAKYILVRLLGGVGYWSYGVEQLCQLAKDNHIKLALLSADGKEDQELKRLSSIESSEYQQISALVNAGGKANADSLFLYLKSQLQACLNISEQSQVQAPNIRHFLKTGIYWQGSDQPQLEDLIQDHWVDDAPIIAIIFYRALFLAGDLNAIDGMIHALQQQGLNPLPLYTSSLKEAEAAMILRDILSRANVDIILNSTAFAVSDGNMMISIDQNEAPPPLNINSAPIFQIVLSSSQKMEWEASKAGLNARDLAMNVVLPELDGRIFTRIIGFKSKPELDALTHAMVMKSESEPRSASFVAGITAQWARLRKTAAKDKQIAIILANYPNRDGRLANGVGLDTPQSVYHSLVALKQAGYIIENCPKDGQELINIMKAGPTNQGWKGRKIGVRLSLVDYNSAWELLPAAMQEAVVSRWGKPENDPSFDGEYFRLSLVKFGNVQVGIQPARGYQIDPKETYHSADLVPPHGYFAFYFYLRNQAKIHAVIHFGKHGNLEWLPGKALALSEECYPDALLGTTPNFYPFIVNDPGEGSQAKRRISAVILDHLTPPLTQAGHYGETAALEAKMDEYYEAQGLDPVRLQYLETDILDLSRQCGITDDINLDDREAVSSRFLKIDNYLCDLKELQIRDGLHIFGKSPKGSDEINLLAAMMRCPRGTDLKGGLNLYGQKDQGLDQSLLRAIALDLDLGRDCEDGFDPLTCIRGEPYQGLCPNVLTALSPKVWRINGDCVEHLEMLAHALISGQQEASQIGVQTETLISKTLPIIRQGLSQSGANEIGNLLKALSGQYIPAGPSGAPTRGKPEILPTGRNFFSIDSRALPTPMAWRLGFASASALIDRYLQDHGEYPKSLALSAWGTSNMRTGGDDIAQALALIGVQPSWEVGSRRVIGFEVLPLSLLDRPRVDVTLRCSGFFRDAFPAQMTLLDRAFRAVIELDEPDNMNPLRAHARQAEADAIAQGVSSEKAKLRAGSRIFSSKPGTYGAGLQAMMDENLWQDRKDFASPYLEWSSFLYGDGLYGEEAKQELIQRLKSTDAILHNQDNREHDLLDSDDYYQFEGGLSASIFALTDKQVTIYHNDHSLPEKPVIRTLGEEIGRVVQARAANPKWIAGVMRHGYKGAFEIAATVDYLYAFSATTRQVAEHHFAKLFQAYIADEQVRGFLIQNNPDAYQDILKRFEDAIDRGLWQPKSNLVNPLLASLKV